MSFVSRQERDGVSVLTLDRPPANAFSPELVADLASAVSESSGARALVLASANPKIFSGGWDLPRVSALPRGEMKAFLEAFCDLLRQLFVHPAPIVAALSGHAIAGGLIVASAADERYAGDGQARVGLSEVALGVPLPACCLELFRFVLGSRAMERLVGSAENMPVEDALEIGLVDRAVAAGELLSSAVDRAAALARGSAQAYAETKRRARAGTLARFDAARRDDPFLDYWFSPDARHRISTLVAKLSTKS